MDKALEVAGIIGLGAATLIVFVVAIFIALWPLWVALAALKYFFS